jgi:hypothetical protein
MPRDQPLPATEGKTETGGQGTTALLRKSAKLYFRQVTSCAVLRGKWRRHYIEYPHYGCLISSTADRFQGKGGQDGFGGLEISMLASGTRVRGFKPGRSRQIFRASEKSSACPPSEGK